MNKTNQKPARNLFTQVQWWGLFLLTSFYALYSFSMAGTEIFSLLGLIEDAPIRATPLVFIFHTLAGGVALIAGPLQFNQTLLKKRQKLHRKIGRTYVWAIWIASIGGLWDALFFDVTLLTKIVFGLLSILWFWTTTVGFLQAKNRKFKTHREWMIRSFALSFFFVTFSFWVPALASTSLPEAISFPLGVFLSWAINLIAVELWIRFPTKARAKHTSLVLKEYAEI